jgi:hypothetical protein
MFEALRQFYGDGVPSKGGSAFARPLCCALLVRTDLLNGARKPGRVSLKSCNSIFIEAVPKLQFLEQQLMKTAVLQPAGRKTARACYKITDFGTGSITMKFRYLTKRTFGNCGWVSGSFSKRTGENRPVVCGAGNYAKTVFSTRRENLRKLRFSEKPDKGRGVFSFMLLQNKKESV